MFEVEERIRHYRALAVRLRALAAGTRFVDLRCGYFELAAQFERLADRASARRSGRLAGRGALAAAIDAVTLPASRSGADSSP